MRRLVRFACLVSWLSLLFVASLNTAAVSAAGNNLIRVRLGNANDVNPALNGPSFHLQGNGSPNTTAFQAHVNQVASAPLDVVVLAASTGGNATAECELIVVLSNVNSCETIIIKKVTLASDAGATVAVTNAEIVYFAGGDQCNYVGWQGSTVYEAVKSVVARGGGVGGGSAGLAIQGDYVFDACNGTISSDDALANPYRRTMRFTYDYFNWQNLNQVITDSHFVARDRMGRMMAFLCRQIQDGVASAAYGVGIDEGGTTFVVDKNGLGRLYGNVAYIVLADHTPEQCVEKQSLTYSNYKIWRVADGGAYDFKNRPTTGYYLRSVTDGVIVGDPYNP